MGQSLNLGGENPAYDGQLVATRPLDGSRSEALSSQGQVACQEPLSECCIALYCGRNGLALEPEGSTL